MPHLQAQVRNMHTAHDCAFYETCRRHMACPQRHREQDFSGRKIGSMLGNMKTSTRSRTQLALLVLMLTGLSACAEDPNAHHYHARIHKGQVTPDWYRPPATPQDTAQYTKTQNLYRKQAVGAPQGVQYDR
jgi:hypothetical protein